MSQESRLDKVEKSLAPKQAVVRWLQEIQSYQNATEYVHFLRTQPDNEAPISKLTEQIDKAVRQAMRGRKPEIVNAAVRRSVRDVVFLIKLHLQCNFYIMSNLRQWRLSQIALAEALDRLHTDMLLRTWMVEIADRVDFQTPYPLDPETASIVDSALRYHVHSFQALEEESYINDWLWEYLIEKGAKVLPLSASRYDEAGKKHPNVTPENEAEIRACFPDEAQFELFRSGQDYTCDLANVTDAEYNQHYDTIVKGIQELVQSGKVQAGWMITLKTIPIPFLQNVPLIEGKWLDRRLAELAEWGALLQAKGYQVQENPEAHQLAMVSYLKPDGEKADPAELQDLRRKATLFLKKYSGRTRQIEGQTYLHFADYSSWRGRKVKGDLAELIQEGLMTTSWNLWIAAQGNKKAIVAGITVGNIATGIEAGDYYSCAQNTKAQLRRREGLLAYIRTWNFKPDRHQELILAWKESVHYCLVELYTYRQAVEQIQQAYFAGQTVLFLEVSRDLAKIITEAETTVNNFNASFVKTFQYYPPIDLAAIHDNAVKETSRVMAYIVDMAKAESLDCLGEGKAGMELVEKYV